MRKNSWNIYTDYISSLDCKEKQIHFSRASETLEEKKNTYVDQMFGTMIQI